MTRSRALLTDKERKRIGEQGDYKEQRRYEAISRTRRRIKEELPEDIEILENHHPDLLEELKEVVCDDS
ncbi:MAG: hypothetical protein ABEJ83_04795 [Candidatus Nanohaloarchaea archaeon]